MRRLEQHAGDELVAAWLVGSTALGDFDSARSDVDVQAVADTQLPRPTLERIASSLAEVPCPVRGLEFVLYARSDVPAFQLNLNTGPGMEHHEGYDPSAEPGFWFTLDVAIARQAARPLIGPHPREVLPALPREAIAAALRESLAWYAAHDDAQAVLTACRAWVWAAEGRWLSKGDAATWAVERLDDPAPVVKALAKRADPEAAGPASDEAAALVARVRGLLAG
jgi:hypothetical protein